MLRAEEQGLSYTISACDDMETSTQHYSSVPPADDHDEARSSTEIEESIMGVEKAWKSSALQMTNRPRRRTLMTTIKPYLHIVNTLLLGIVIGLQVLAWEVKPVSPAKPMQVGGDYKGSGPEFTLRTIKWEADMGFTPPNASDWFTDRTLATWNSIMPVNAHRGPEGQSFSTTTMTHSLHCLFMMGRIYSGIDLNITHVLPEAYQVHFFHCIDYLRQSIMCSADLAVELHEPTDPDDLGPLDGGWSGRHVCKAYGEVKSYLEQEIVDAVRVVLPIDD